MACPGPPPYLAIVPNIGSAPLVAHRQVDTLQDLWAHVNGLIVQHNVYDPDELLRWIMSGRADLIEEAGRKVAMGVIHLRLNELNG